jgi:exonuclease III
MKMLLNGSKKILSWNWNVRDLNSASRKSSVRTFIESCGADVIYLQETKMQEINKGKVLAILGTYFDQFIFLPSNGASGGILVSWRRHIKVTGLNRVDSYSVPVQEN